MKCPVCSNDFQEFHAGAIMVDICSDGCSGIWLEKEEYSKCDEHTEPFPKELLRVRKSPNVLIDRNVLRSCPSCAEKNVNQTMTRIALDAETRFELDECPACSGVWLDLGELEHIRNLDEDLTARRAKLDAYEKSALAQVEGSKRTFAVKAILRKFLGH